MSSDKELSGLERREQMIRLIRERGELTVKEMAEKSDEAYVSLHVDKSVPMEEVVKIMNIAKKHEYKLILATQPGE